MNTTVARPTRLHHHAHVSSNMERTRQFYEDIVGLPLVTVWCEGEGQSAYCHAYFELEDASCLAFFQFADEAAGQEHLRARATSPFFHVAINATKDVQARVQQAAQSAGVEPVLIDHGYCTSLYLSDPDGLIVELTVDTQEAAAEIAERRKQPHKELERWMAGDHTSNNAIRHDGVSPS